VDVADGVGLREDEQVVVALELLRRAAGRGAVSRGKSGRVLERPAARGPAAARVGGVASAAVAWSISFQRSPRKSSSENLYCWMVVPIAPSITMIRSCMFFSR